MVFIARPYINNMIGAREFDTAKAALNYLNSLLPDDFPFLGLEDAVLIGKLYRKDGTDVLPPKRKPGRPKKGT